MITLPERIGDYQTVIEKYVKEMCGNLRVSMPCIVTAFDPQNQTVDCIPAIRELVSIAGEIRYVNLPELKEVPIEIPRAGNYVITLPITVGQECRVTFQDLCIDGWWTLGGIQNWNDLRRHDFSDAIATFSPWSQPNSLASYQTDALEIRNLDRDQYVRLSQEGISLKQKLATISITESEISLQLGNNSIKITTGGIELNGTLTINSVPYLSHAHSGVTPGPGITGMVVS